MDQESRRKHLSHKTGIRGQGLLTVGKKNKHVWQVTTHKVDGRAFDNFLCYEWHMTINSPRLWIICCELFSLPFVMDVIAIIQWFFCTPYNWVCAARCMPNFHFEACVSTCVSVFELICSSSLRRRAKMMEGGVVVCTARPRSCRVLCRCLHCRSCLALSSPDQHLRLALAARTNTRHRTRVGAFIPRPL